MPTATAPGPTGGPRRPGDEPQARRRPTTQRFEHKRVGRGVRERIERLLPGRGALGVVALQPQRAVDGVPYPRLVVDHQDVHAARVRGKAESPEE
jgi:hypothetical protein